MNKTVKNIVIIFTLVSIVAVTVFSVELVLLNRDAGGSENGLEPLENAGISVIDIQPSLEPAVLEDPGLGDDNGQHENSEQLEDPADPDETEDLPPLSPPIRHTMPMEIDERELIVYANEELFDVSAGESYLLFTFTGSGNASLEIAFDFITPPGGMEQLSLRFLTDYLDGGESTVVGYGGIRDSELNGVLVTGEKNGTTYEAWIHSLTGSNTDGMALVFVIDYQNDTQRDALYTVLDTVEMILDEGDDEDDEDDQGEDEDEGDDEP